MRLFREPVAVNGSDFAVPEAPGATGHGWGGGDSLRVGHGR